MFNFLQLKNLKRIFFEYVLRLDVFLLSFVLISVVVLVALFMPTYFFAKYKNDSVKNELVSIQIKNNTKEDPLIIIKQVNQLSDVLSTNSSSTTYSEIINKIISLKNKGIKILSINLTQDVNGIKTAAIDGINDTRDNLTSFETDIKTDGYFSQVIFPVSDFLKDINSEFSATLIL